MVDFKASHSPPGPEGPSPKPSVSFSPVCGLSKLGQLEVKSPPLLRNLLKEWQRQEKLPRLSRLYHPPNHSSSSNNADHDLLGLELCNLTSLKPSLVQDVRHLSHKDLNAPGHLHPLLDSPFANASNVASVKLA